MLLFLLLLLLVLVPTENLELLLFLKTQASLLLFRIISIIIIIIRRISEYSRPFRPWGALILTIANINFVRLALKAVTFYEMIGLFSQKWKTPGPLASVGIPATHLHRFHSLFSLPRHAHRARQPANPVRVSVFGTRFDSWSWWSSFGASFLYVEHLQFAQFSAQSRREFGARARAGHTI